MKIKEFTLEFILEACRGAYPNEFLALLRAENNVIYEILVIPGSKFESHSSSLDKNMVPLDNTIVGSIHSHPGPANPSKADLNFFARNGKVHMIIGYPFTRDTINVFNSAGDRSQLEIVK